MSAILSPTEFYAIVEDYNYNLADGEDEIAAECWQAIKNHDEELRSRLRDAEEALHEIAQRQMAPIGWHELAVEHERIAKAHLDRYLLARHAADQSTQCEHLRVEAGVDVCLDCGAADVQTQDQPCAQCRHPRRFHKRGKCSIIGCGADCQGFVVGTTPDATPVVPSPTDAREERK